MELLVFLPAFLVKCSEWPYFKLLIHWERRIWNIWLRICARSFIFLHFSSLFLLFLNLMSCSSRSNMLSPSSSNLIGSFFRTRVSRFFPISFNMAMPCRQFTPSRSYFLPLVAIITNISYFPLTTTLSLRYSSQVNEELDTRRELVVKESLCSFRLAISDINVFRDLCALANNSLTKLHSSTR